MRKNVFLIVSVALLASCVNHENLYDPERVKEEAKANFPVQNIDPNQDWATRGTRTLDVTVNETSGQTYTIKVFTANPFQAEENPRLLTETTVKNGSTTSLKFDVSLALDYVYVMCKAGEKDYSVKAIPLAGDKFVASFGKQVGARAAALPGGIEFDDGMYNPAGASNVTSMIDFDQLVGMGGRFQIAKGQTITGENLAFMGQNLYVSGTLKVKSLHLSSNSAISILEGGTLIVDETLSLYGGDFYNGGTVNSYTTIISSGTKWLNGGAYIGSSLQLSVGNTIAQNDCKLTINDNQILLSQGTFINNGYAKCERFSILKGAKLNLSGISIFNVSGKADLGDGTITGSSNSETRPCPLFAAGSLKVYNNETTTVTNTVYTTAGGDNALIGKFTVIKATIGAMPAGGCVPPVTVEGDNTENIPLSGCTIGFEDVNSQSVTDYDFNDVVIWVSNVDKESFAHIYLVAVGATNKIKVGYATPGGKHIYLFDKKEVHDLLGKSATEMFNTSGVVITQNLPMQSIQVEQRALDGYNFFIEVNDDTNNRIYSRNQKLGDTPFGLCVSEDWNYPAEKAKINEAYEGFGEWGKNKDTNKTWYKDGKFDKVRSFNSALLNKK